MFNDIAKKKFLIVGPTFYEWDLGKYLENLFRSKNIKCRTFAYSRFKSNKEANRQLLKTARMYRPDVVLGLKMERIYPKTIQTLKGDKIFVFLWYMDCFTKEAPQWIKPLIRKSDVFLTTAKGMVPKYNALGSTPVYWVYEGAYLPAFTYTRPLQSLKNYSAQVAFVGNIFQPPVLNRKLALRRYRLLKKIGKKFQLKVWGLQGNLPQKKRKFPLNYPVIKWPAYNEELVKICRASDIILGINTVNTVELYFSNRTFLTLASGGFHLTHYVPGMETMFTNHKHLVWFNSDKECLDLIGYYLKRPLARKKIASEGQKWARRKYNMRMQLDRILNIVDKHYEK